MRALLSEFIDQSLHWRTARSLAAHLASCPPCAGYVASVERTIILYRERPVVDVPPQVRGHLREVLRERHASSPKKGAGRCCLKAAAAKSAASRRGGPKKAAGKP